MAGSNAQLRRQRSSTPAEILEMLGGDEVFPPAATVVPAAPADAGGQTPKQRLGSPHLTVAEAAEFLGCSRRTIQRRMSNGVLPFHRPPGCRPFFLKDELVSWLRNPETLCLRRPECDAGREDTYAQTGLSQKQIEEIYRRARKREVPDDASD